jgi:hypothetical protein
VVGAGAGVGAIGVGLAVELIPAVGIGFVGFVGGVGAGFSFGAKVIFPDEASVGVVIGGAMGIVCSLTSGAGIDVGAGLISDKGDTGVGAGVGAGVGVDTTGASSVFLTGILSLPVSCFK